MEGALSEESFAVKPLTVVVAVIVGALLICFGSAVFLGGTKMRPLFGMSADALAGPMPARDAGVP